MHSWKCFSPVNFRCDLELWPAALAIELHLGRVKVNHRVRYLNRSKVMSLKNIARTDKNNTDTDNLEIPGRPTISYPWTYPTSFAYIIAWYPSDVPGLGRRKLLHQEHTILDIHGRRRQIALSQTTRSRTIVGLHEWMPDFANVAGCRAVMDASRMRRCAHRLPVRTTGARR